MSHQIAYMIGGARLGTDDRGQGDKGLGIEDRDDSENGQRQGTGTCCAAAWRSQQRAALRAVQWRCGVVQRRCGAQRRQRAKIRPLVRTGWSFAVGPLLRDRRRAYAAAACFLLFFSIPRGGLPPLWFGQSFFVELLVFLAGLFPAEADTHGVHSDTLHLNRILKIEDQSTTQTA